MAYTLPNELSPSAGLSKAFTQGTGLYNMLIQHAMQRAQDKRAELANARADELQPLQKLLLGAKTQSAQSNAAWNNMLMGLPNGEGAPQQQGGNNQQPMVNENGEPAQPGMQQPQDYSALKQKFPINQPQQDVGIGEERLLSKGNPLLHNMDRYAGIKGVPPVQTHYDTNGNLITRYPSGKVTMQKVGPSSAENKKIEEQDKNQAKIDLKHQEIQEQAKNDLPKLEKVLDSLKIMRDIAENDPTLFGHTILGFDASERFAKTSDNPNVGTFQTEGVDPIVSTEMNLSSKGNVPALKFAIANKPNFAETQPVALAKIKASIDKIEKTIAQNKKVAGIQEEGNFALMIDPESNKPYKVPVDDVEARAKEGWKHAQ